MSEIARARAAARRHRRLFASLLAVGVLLGFAPLLNANPYAMRLAHLAFLNVLLASAWNMIGGFAGQTSFGNASLFGIGAYASSMLWIAGVPPLATLPVAAGLAAFYGVLWGWPCLRLRGPYFAIATIGVSEATRVLVNNVEAAGGASGLTLPIDEAFGSLALYGLGSLLALLAVLSSHVMLYSRLGLGLRALREDARAAAASGVPVARQQVVAFAVAAALTGLGGAYYAFITLYIVPEKVFGFDLSISLVLMVLVGGLGTVAGPVLGALIFLVLEQFVLASFADVHLAAFGILLILIILFEPRGLWPRLERWALRIFRRTA